MAIIVAVVSVIINLEKSPLPTVKLIRTLSELPSPTQNTVGSLVVILLGVTLQLEVQSCRTTLIELDKSKQPARFAAFCPTTKPPISPE